MNADCVNEDGGYKCSCPAGTDGDGFYCDDINEVSKLQMNGNICCELPAM